MLTVGKPAATIVLVLGPPGCGKTRLMVDTIAAATEGTPYRAHTADRRPCRDRMPPCAPATAKLMCHKASLTYNVGFPAQTITRAMRMYDWQPAGNGPAQYTASAAEAIAKHTLHIVEECQALVQHLGTYFTHLRAAHEQARGNAHGVLADCAHIFSMDPQQSACREHGVTSVGASGAVHLAERRLVMPWDKVMECAGPPSPALQYKILVMHDNFRMRGLLFRLLRHVYAPLSLPLCCMCAHHPPVGAMLCLFLPPHHHRPLLQDAARP